MRTTHMGNKSQIHMTGKHRPSGTSAKPRPANVNRTARMRVLNFADKLSAERLEWLDRFDSTIEQFNYQPDDVRYLSTSDEAYDLLFMSGNDPIRISKAIRQGSEILKGRLVVAIVSSSTPQCRARPLNPGADDAFDVSKMQHSEDLARIESMWIRYQGSQANLEAIHQRNVAIEAICEVGSLTKKERLILDLLMEAGGKAVSYHTIKNALCEHHDQITGESLKVLICILRKKLRFLLKIISQTNIGYILNE